MFEARLCRVVVKIKISLNFSDFSELPISATTTDTEPGKEAGKKLEKQMLNQTCRSQGGKKKKSANKCQH
jgi:hypothetical protein